MTSKQAGRPRKYGSQAERQAAYRQRVWRGESGIAARTEDPAQGATRLDIMLPANAKMALQRIARHRQAGLADVLAQLITSQDDKIIRQLNNDELDSYLQLD